MITTQADIATDIPEYDLSQKNQPSFRGHKQHFEEAGSQFSNVERAKELAASIRWKAIENLEKYLIEFEAGFIKQGGKVVWAQNAGEAYAQALKIVHRYSSHKIVYLKNSHAEKIFLTDQLQQKGYEVSEHASDADISKKTKSFTCITGADFLIADSGAACVTSDNQKELTALAGAKVKIIIADIAGIIPAMSDLNLLLPLKAAFSKGKTASSYNMVLTPCKEDKAAKLYVILTDMGATEIMADPIQRQALHCIECEACITVNPVWKATGKNIKKSIQQAPYLRAETVSKKEISEALELNAAFLLDGRSTTACPVHIDFNKMLLHIRKTAVSRGLTGTAEGWFYFFWKKAMMKRLTRMKGIKAAGYFIHAIFNKSDSGLRMPKPLPPKTFNEIWRSTKGTG